MLPPSNLISSEDPIVWYFAKFTPFLIHNTYWLHRFRPFSHIIHWTIQSAETVEKSCYFSFQIHIESRRACWTKSRCIIAYTVDCTQRKWLHCTSFTSFASFRRMRYVSQIENQNERFLRKNQYILAKHLNEEMTLMFSFFSIGFLSFVKYMRYAPTSMTSIYYNTHRFRIFVGLIIINKLIRKVWN